MGSMNSHVSCRRWRFGLVAREVGERGAAGNEALFVFVTRENRKIVNRQSSMTECPVRTCNSMFLGGAVSSSVVLLSVFVTFFTHLFSSSCLLLVECLTVSSSVIVFPWG